MKTKLFILLVPFLLGAALAPSLWAEQACGDDGTTCSDQERCVEHVIAMFSDDHPTAPPYIQGECVAKEKKSAEFWCGNRECRAGIFGSPSVCCVNTPEQSSAPQYSCAYSELNCPGNTQQLSIRDNQPNRNLRRG